MPETPAPSSEYSGLCYFKLTHLGPQPLAGSAAEPLDTIFRLYITPEALCFGRVGEAYSNEDLGAQYDLMLPQANEFMQVHPANFRLSLASLQRILLDRRPHLHNPVNGGSLRLWAEGVEYTFLLDYATDADLLLEALRQAAHAAHGPTPESREDPALRIMLHPARAPEDALHIQLQWQRGMGLLLLVFAICWSGLIAYLASVLLPAFFPTPTINNVFVIVALAIFLLAGLFLFYYALTHIFNTTRLILRGRTLLLRSVPLPWKSASRALTIPPAAEIQIQTRRLEHWSEYPTITTYVYDLIATAPGEPPLRLISLSRLTHALRMRKALRAALM